MKAFVFCLAAVLSAQPVIAASLDEARLSGVVMGETMCALVRHGAPKSVAREEFARITRKFVDAGVLDLRRHSDAYLSTVEQLIKECPSRGLPDA